jgi:hypothetical protein
MITGLIFGSVQNCHQLILVFAERLDNDTVRNIIVDNIFIFILHPYFLIFKIIDYTSYKVNIKTQTIGIVLVDYTISEPFCLFDDNNNSIIK